MMTHLTFFDAVCFPGAVKHYEQSTISPKVFPNFSGFMNCFFPSDTLTERSADDFYDHDATFISSWSSAVAPTSSDNFFQLADFVSVTLTSLNLSQGISRSIDNDQTHFKDAG
jgi:hypothetical protein